jgi:hypothetical protein
MFDDEESRERCVVDINVDVKVIADDSADEGDTSDTPGNESFRPRLRDEIGLFPACFS